MFSSHPHKRHHSASKAERPKGHAHASHGYQGEPLPPWVHPPENPQQQHHHHQQQQHQQQYQQHCHHHHHHHHNSGHEHAQTKTQRHHSIGSHLPGCRRAHGQESSQAAPESSHTYTQHTHHSGKHADAHGHSSKRPERPARPETESHEDPPTPSSATSTNSFSCFFPFTPSPTKSFDGILTDGAISVAESHAECEPCDVVIGGMESVLGGTVYERQLNFRNEHDYRVKFLLNEPRGHVAKSAVFLLNPIGSKAERCLLFAKNDEYVPFSISGIISAANVLAELPQAGGPTPALPCHRYIFETIAGRIMAEASYIQNDAGQCRCEFVTVYGVPSFVVKLDHIINVPGMGPVKVDIAFGGVFCAFIDVESVEMNVKECWGEDLVAAGECIRHALHDSSSGLDIVHPKNSSIRGISNIVFTERVERDGDDLFGLSATVVAPGRLDRSPSGTSLSAWLAIQHRRGQIKDEIFRSFSLLGSSLFGGIRGECEVGKYKAIYPRIQGRAWITAFKQVVLDPRDPYVSGFRGADKWGPKLAPSDEEVHGLGIHLSHIHLEREKTPVPEMQRENWHGEEPDLGEPF